MHAFLDAPRASIGSSWTPSGLSGTGTAGGAATPAPGPPPSSRGKPLRYAVVKRALPSSVLAISASSRARHSSEWVELTSPLAPETSFSQSMFHEISLADVQTSTFPIASASAIAAGELTSGNTIRTSLTFLGPSQGLADREFRNARLTVRTLCMPLSLWQCSRELTPLRSS